jgi:CDP-glycerol glycerophosphotransferase
MKRFINFIIIIILRIFSRTFNFLPLKEDRFLFIANEGRGYTCNPKYIFEYLYEKYHNRYEFIWCMNNHEDMPRKFSEVKTVRFLSYKYIKYEMTSKYIITNFTVDPFVLKRKNQIFINTWHGMVYKKVAIDNSIYMKKLRSMRSKTTNYVISECAYFTKLMSESWLIDKSKFLPIGMPRNDIFFNDLDIIIKKIRKYYNINSDLKIILYAPTYRGALRCPDIFNPCLNITNIIKVFEEKYNNKFIVLSRSHHTIIDNKLILENAISVNDYPDMQELLCAADVLITDYSSSMWDFSFTYRPCFVYAPDLREYEEKVGFHTPIEQWPFPISETTEQLIQNIKKFDEEEYIMAIKQHHTDLGSYETGTATENLCKILLG